MSIDWVDAVSKTNLDNEEMLAFEHKGKQIALYSLDDGYYATDALCTHEQAPLCNGFLDDGIIECPKHNARFDVRTGKVLRKPAKENLVSYPTKIEGDRLFVGIES